MKSFNNYDMSSTGINVTLDIGYDECTALDEFHSNFDRMINDLFLYTDYGEIYSLDVPVNICSCTEILISNKNDRSFAAVLVPVEELKLLWGVNHISLAKLKEEFERLFFEQPYMITLTINNKSFHEGDLLTDAYNLDLQEIELTLDSYGIDSEAIQEVMQLFKYAIDKGGII